MKIKMGRYRIHFDDPKQNLNSFIKQIKIPVNNNNIIDLVEKAKNGDINAKRTIVGMNMGLILNVANKYRHSGVAFEDLVAEGCIAILDSIPRFDNSLGKFQTYAGKCIQGYILNLVNEQKKHRILSSYFGITETKKKLSFDNNNGNGKTKNNTHYKLSPQQKKELDEIVKQYQEILNPYASTDNSPENILIKKEELNYVYLLLEKLNPVEVYILLNRFEVKGEKKTFRKLGIEVNKTPEGVRQIFIRAFDKLKAVYERNKLIQKQYSLI
ncbi:MAG: sigma-70 family RNA polymerase sigma factor [Candidatus Woesearchaeota archaeon]